MRVGNAAYSQRQHDMWGAVVAAIEAYTRGHRRIEDRLWRIVQTQVECALEHWREPDQGIWEVRSSPQHFTFSKVVCWVAADAGARVADRRGEDAVAARWRTAAEEIHDDVLANAVDERGVFTQHYATKALDASALLISRLGFLPASDDRIRNTVHAIAEELTEDDMVLRYRVEDTEDGLERRGRQLHHLLVLAGIRARGDWRADEGANAVQQAAFFREPAATLCRGDRPPQRSPPR